MKVSFKLSVALIMLSTIFNSSQAGLVQDVTMKQMGSCETRDLAYMALRFTKIPLRSLNDSKNLFLRMIFFIRPDNSQAIRLTTQELLGCQNDSLGNEVCSYRPVDNSWIDSHWSDLSDLGAGLDLKIAGKLVKENESYKITLPEHFVYSELSGQTFKGNMVKVNFNDHGVNTSNLCPSLR